MNNLTEVEAVRVSGQSINLLNALQQYHRNSGLKSALEGVAIHAIIRATAEEMGLMPNADQLQSAADQFRRENDLLNSGDTQAWLKKNHFSIIDFESLLEQRELTRLVSEAVTKDSEQVFRNDPEQWATLELEIADLHAENLAVEIKSQVVDDGVTLSRAIESCLHNGSRVGGCRHLRLFRNQLDKDLAELLKNAARGELVGPIVSKRGWQLVQLHSVRSAEFNSETKTHIRHRLFQEWLNQKITVSHVTFPLLDLLSGRNDF